MKTKAIVTFMLTSFLTLTNTVKANPPPIDDACKRAIEEAKQVAELARALQINAAQRKAASATDNAFRCIRGEASNANTKASSAKK